MTTYRFTLDVQVDPANIDSAVDAILAALAELEFSVEGPVSAALKEVQA